MRMPDTANTDFIFCLICFIATHAFTTSSKSDEVQVVLAFGAVVLGLHHFITQHFNTDIHSEPEVPAVAVFAAPTPQLPAASANGAVPHGLDRADPALQPAPQSQQAC